MKKFAAFALLALSFLFSPASFGQTLVTYTITAQDLEKIVPGIPTNYAEMAKMEWLGYTSGAEALAEKFHMDQNFLMSLNPFARFIIGESIIVIDPGEQAPVAVTRIVG